MARWSDATRASYVKKLEIIKDARREFVADTLIELNVIPTAGDTPKSWEKSLSSKRIAFYLNTLDEGFFAKNHKRFIRFGLAKRTEVRQKLAEQNVHLELGNGLPGIRQADVKALRQTNTWEKNVLKATTGHNTGRVVEANRMLDAKKLAQLLAVTIKQYLLSVGVE